jgi:hypothetical protein
MSETYVLEENGDTVALDATVAELTRCSPEAQPIYDAVSELVRGIHAGEGATWEAWQMAEISYRVEYLIRSLRSEFRPPTDLSSQSI